MKISTSTAQLIKLNASDKGHILCSYPVARSTSPLQIDLDTIPSPLGHYYQEGLLPRLPLPFCSQCVASTQYLNNCLGFIWEQAGLLLLPTQSIQCCPSQCFALCPERNWQPVQAFVLMQFSEFCCPQSQSFEQIEISRHQNSLQIWLRWRECSSISSPSPPFATCIKADFVPSLKASGWQFLGGSHLP